MSRVIEEENDPEVLRAYLQYTIKLLNEKDKTISTLLSEKAKQAQQQLLADDELLAFKKRIFGKSSEKLASDRPRDKEDPELLLHSKRVAPAPKNKEFKKLFEIKCDHKLTADELSDIAEQYGYAKNSEWEVIAGLYDESEEVDLVPQKLRRKKHRRFKYRLKETKGTDNEIIVSAPGPMKLMPGSSYSIDFGVEVATQKYLYHMPLERIKKQMAPMGLKVSTKTLYSQCFFVACYLEKLCEEIKQEIYDHGLAVHADETPWPINNKTQSDGYMWVISNAVGSYYYFAPTRSGDIAKELIGSYQGPVLTDGYSGYNKVKNLDDVSLAHCWSHVRRKFTDIEENYPKECGAVLNLIKNIFKVERGAQSFDELKSLRIKYSQKIIKELESWLIKTKQEARSESGLIKAINYTMNHWEGLTLFLTDTRVPLTNNDAERAMRQSVMGRKNFYGSRTINGADVTATLYTIIESCKKAELDPKEFIRQSINKAAAGESMKTPMQYAKHIRTH